MYGKVTLILALFVVNTMSPLCQVRLDSLYPLAKYESSGNIIIGTEDGFYIIGNGTDTVPWNALGSLFTSFAFDGTITFSTFTLDPGKRRVYEDRNAVIIDDIAYTIFTGTFPIQIMQFSIYTGEVLRRTGLSNMTGGLNKTIPYSIHQLDSNLLLINSTSLNLYHKRITQLSLYDIDRDSLSFFFNVCTEYDQYITDAILVPDGYILGGYITKGDPWGTDFAAHTVFVWLDSNFVETKRYISQNAPYDWHGYDMIRDVDGSIIGTNCPAHKYFDGIYHWTVGRPALLKLDSVGTLLWQRNMGRNLYHTEHSVFHCLLPSNAGDGYIAAGVQPNFSDSMYYSGVANTNGKGEHMRYEALIAKVSTEGDSLWSRWYYKTDIPFSKNIFMDMIPHPDGGYILTGSSNKEPFALGGTQTYTWILYVDEFGCAVPGCQEIVSSNDPTLPDPIRLYPNPATSDLYIYQQEDEQIQYTIVNLEGHVMTTLTGKQAGTTAIVDVSQYMPGEYFLIKKNTAGRIRSDKWIKL